MKIEWDQGQSLWAHHTTAYWHQINNVILDALRAVREVTSPELQHKQQTRNLVYKSSIITCVKCHRLVKENNCSSFTSSKSKYDFALY